MDNKRSHDAMKILIHCTPSLNIVGVCVIINHWERKTVASERFEQMIVEKEIQMKSMWILQINQLLQQMCLHLMRLFKWKERIPIFNWLMSSWTHILVYWCSQTWWIEISCCKFGIYRVNHKYDKIYNMTTLAQKRWQKNYITTSLENISNLVSKVSAT